MTDIKEAPRAEDVLRSNQGAEVQARDYFELVQNRPEDRASFRPDKLGEDFDKAAQTTSPSERLVKFQNLNKDLEDAATSAYAAGGKDAVKSVTLKPFVPLLLLSVSFRVLSPLLCPILGTETSNLSNCRFPFLTDFQSPISWSPSPD